MRTVLDELCVKPEISVPFLRLNDLFEHHARRSPDAAAILAPDRAPLSYGRLHQHIGEVGRALRGMGIGREDRVALMLPNGPEMAVSDSQRGVERGLRRGQSGLCV